MKLQGRAAYFEQVSPGGVGIFGPVIMLVLASSLACHLQI